MTTEQIKQQLISSIIAKSQDLNWRIVVKNAEISKAKNGNQMLSCYLYLGGSPTYQRNGRTIKRLSIQAETKYSYIFFESHPLWDTLISDLESESFTKVDVKDDGKGNETFNAELDSELPGKMIEFACDAYYMKDAAGNRLLQTMGPNKGQPAVRTAFRVFFPESPSDPLILFNKEYSRITDFVPKVIAGTDNDAELDNSVPA